MRLTNVILKAVPVLSLKQLAGTKSRLQQSDIPLEQLQKQA